jgi:hypothetical protein
MVFRSFSCNIDIAYPHKNMGVGESSMEAFAHPSAPPQIVTNIANSPTKVKRIRRQAG